MSYLCIGLLVAVVLWYERELVKTAVIPLIDVAVSVYFIVALLILIVIELALIVIAPIALFLGYESRDWHCRVAERIMLTKPKGKGE